MKVIMTIEEKAKAYDETTRLLSDWYKNETDIGIKDHISAVCPDVAESEDEKIIKALIDVLNSDFEKDTEINGITVGTIIAWLKYKEQKLTDVPLKTAIQAWRKMRFEVYAQASGNRHESNYSDSNTKMFSLNDIDEIFEKISDSVVEQEPVEHHASEYTDKYIKSSLITMIHGWKNGASHWCSDPKFCDAAINLLKNQEPVDIEAIKAEYYDAGYEDGKEYSQKPAEWSEEDERKLELLRSLIDDAKGGSASYSTMFREMEELDNWLKGIKDRCIPQPKQEWSEDDEKWAEEIRLALKFYSDDIPYVDKLTTWFNNHIRPQLKFRVGDLIKKKDSGTVTTIESIDNKNYYVSKCQAFFPIADQDKYELVEPKLADWTDEDNAMRNFLIKILEVEHPNGLFSTGTSFVKVFKCNSIPVSRIINWLKNLY